VLLFVLWVLIFISFVAAHYGVWSRQEGSTAHDALLELQREAALRSALRLMGSPSFATVRARDASSALGWVRFDVQGLTCWVRWDQERTRVPINDALEFAVRAQLEKMFPQDPERARSVADAILDWRDPDSLVRLNGAERDSYAAEGKPGPADGPYKALTELLLVRGVTPDIFWGDPEAQIQWIEDLRSGHLPTPLPEEATMPSSLLDAFALDRSAKERFTLFLQDSRSGWTQKAVAVVKREGARRVPEVLYRSWPLSVIRDP
jgi:hypothetical protein